MRNSITGQAAILKQHRHCLWKESQKQEITAPNRRITAQNQKEQEQRRFAKQKYRNFVILARPIEYCTHQRLNMFQLHVLSHNRRQNVVFVCWLESGEDNLFAGI